jgi:hypothetical protein
MEAAAPVGRAPLRAPHTYARIQNTHTQNPAPNKSTTHPHFKNQAAKASRLLLPPAPRPSPARTLAGAAQTPRLLADGRRGAAPGHGSRRIGRAAQGGTAPAFRS